MKPLIHSRPWLTIAIASLATVASVVYLLDA